MVDQRTTRAGALHFQRSPSHEVLMLQRTKQLLSGVIGIVAGLVLFVVALIFVWVLALIFAVIGLAAWLYLSWRFRSLAKAAGGTGDGPVVIEGEYRAERGATESIELDRANQNDAGATQRATRPGP